MALVQTRADRPAEQDWVQGLSGISRGAADERVPMVSDIDLTLVVVKLL